MRRFFACLFAGLIALAVTACSAVPEQRAPQRPRNSQPVTLTGPPTRETQACFTDLSTQNVRFSPLPDRDFGGGCMLSGTVQLIDYGVPTTNLKATACPLTRIFVAWVRNGLVPAGREILGSEVVKVETMGSYACRNTIGTAQARLSEHATGNAIDVSGVVLADGRRITIQRDWASSDPAVREFLQVIRRSACRRFRTVLSPDYNAAHHDHLHLDLGGRPLCR